MNIKLNKITAALVGLGVISLASAASAQQIIYLTGSTAIRKVVYSACTTPGEVFAAANGTTVPTGPSVISSGSAFTGNGANQIAYEGYIKTGSTYTQIILDCDFTGSEAGIAATAGASLSQNVNGGTYALPGVPAAFLTSASGYTAVGSAGAVTPDLTMSDTSQAVSLTPATGATQLHDYGIVGIIPFTWMKGYESSPDSSWTHLSNVTIPELAVVIGGETPASFLTANVADTDNVVVVGRNEGSGTRVNTLLNLNYGLKTAVDQFAVNSTYPSGTPGVLTFGSTTAAFSITEVLNDGYDGGSSVQKALNVDASGSGYTVIGYLGMSDAANAAIASSGGGDAAYLTLDGVAESNLAVEQGQYSFWGHEHVLGQKTEYSGTSIYNYTGSALETGIKADETAHSYGVSPTGTDYVIPTTLMTATKSTDVGYPTP